MYYVYVNKKYGKFFGNAYIKLGPSTYQEFNGLGFAKRRFRNSNLMPISDEYIADGRVSEEVIERLLNGRKGELIVGSRVRLIEPNPIYKLGGVKVGEVGTVTGLNGSYITIDFPTHHAWKGLKKEVSLLDSKEALDFLGVGDNVKIKKSSKYYKDGDFLNPKDTQGTVKSVEGGKYIVSWGDVENLYDKEDLEKVE